MSFRLWSRLPDRLHLFAVLCQLLILILLAGCAVDGKPADVISNPARYMGAGTTRAELPGSQGIGLPTATESPIQITPSPTETSTPAAASYGEDELRFATVQAGITPAPLRTGVRPFQAALLRPPELGPEPTVEWRPPPVAAPHALHPDDHYWLARPLSSDRRNYELEVYPFGNVPVLAALRPYRVHHGSDYPNDKGSPIFATSSGVVVWAGPFPNPVSGINYYGNTVIILHDWQWQGQNVYTLYAHTLELFVEVGDHVEQGQLLAGVGASGEVSGPHLHLEVRVGANHYDSVRNPALWLAPFEGWGTLAGRFIDNRGQLIHGALVTIRAVDVDSEVGPRIRHVLTYAPSGIMSDESWNENFAFGDLPAGEYTIEFRTAGRIYERDVTVKPEITNYIVVQADIYWVPTAVPTPTPTSTPSPTTTTAPGIESTPG